MRHEIIFEPLRFRNLTVKNRIFRSNIAGRLDNYDGSGNQARINWEEKFARGGVGAILSSFVPVAIRGRIVPNYATIDCDDRIPFWRKVGDKVHQYDCRFILQLSHSGRQQDIRGIENRHRKALSSTNKIEAFHGIVCQAMTRDEIKQTIQLFADGARRAREADLDGVELHAANGYLITQFLSSAINDRQDEYGGSLTNRARILLEIVEAVRGAVGRDFHLQVKISAEDQNNALYPWEGKGNTLADTIQICKWLEQNGVDAIHVSSGSMFPHPRNPAGTFPVETARDTYDTMLSEGARTRFNYRMFSSKLLQPVFRWAWYRTVKDLLHAKAFEGVNVRQAGAIKQNVAIPVLCTGGFQSASFIADVLQKGLCDAVSIARPLLANNDLVKLFEQGKEPEKPCTYCNKCTLNALENPLGCYDVSRYDGDYDKMVQEILTVFKPAPFEESQSFRDVVPVATKASG
jgi:2,4-dienoyl-CoA reductase-like NADH-dependent reductase (Old Yellow Enzyme family)